MSNEEVIPVENVVVPVAEPEVPAEVVAEPEPAAIPEEKPELSTNEPEIKTPLSPIEPVEDAEADVQPEPSAEPEVPEADGPVETVFAPNWEELVVEGKHRIEWSVTQTGAFRIRPLSFQGPTYDSDTLAEGLARVPLLY